jgi:deazaflavin-dependent oxidoreductase (nitroreductase family)
VRVIAQPKPPTGIRRQLFRLPIRMFQLRLGWLLGPRFLLVNHVGRVSGTRRQVVLEVVERDLATASYVVPSGYAGRADWYRNVCAHPEVTIQTGRRAMSATARTLTADEGGELLIAYARRNPRLTAKLMRLLGFEIDGSDADYRELAAEIPFVRFTVTAGENGRRPHGRRTASPSADQR